MSQRLLPQGGRIAVVAPSGHIADEYLHDGLAALRAAGFAVDVMPHVAGPAQGVFSAADSQRAADLHLALSDPRYDVVWCTRGGYGAMRTLEALEPYGGWRSVFSQTDKMIVGFSDITALHSASAVVGQCGILGPMLKHIATHGVDSPDVQATLSILRGDGFALSRPAMAGSREGVAEGRVIGGNLSIVYSLASTALLPPPDGAILFIEDLSEYRYHIDRMIRALRFSGYLSRLSGLIVGQMTGMRDGATPFGADAFQIISDAVADYHYPVFIGYPSGHAPEENYPLIIGGHAKLEVENGLGTLIQRL